MDNCSPQSLARLPGLVEKIKQVTGPEKGELLYRPLAAPGDLRAGLEALPRPAAPGGRARAMRANSLRCGTG